ncbi:hypothetical protein GQ53DRAFT_644626 [Thozetella sp. PMI_491]|nr:hypothetical protein GQ53DRAFT_644626 [Thozetella sp. PMI_491]
MTSAEDQEILAKIGQLAGQINRKKNQQAGLASAPAHYHPYQRMSVRLYAYNMGSHVDGFARKASYSSRARGGYASRGRPHAHRHRSLVLNGASQTNPAAATSASGSSWVTKTDRHLQLINASVYEKEAQSRARAIEQTQRQKQVARNERERSKLFHHVTSLKGSAAVAATGKYELEIEGVRFVVAKNGSKLVKVPGGSHLPASGLRTSGAHRVAGDGTAPKATPKMAIVGGVRFYRSKNGNLYRHGIVKAQRYVERRPCAPPLTHRLCRQSGAIKKVNVACKTFSTTGSCAKGPRCRYLHDAARVAVCTHFLQKQQCFNGDSCDLSHDLTPQRIPTCMHFLRDGCTKPSCRYAHNKTSPSAPVCRAFGLYGYCEKGLECPDRHVFECPDFSNHGKCKNKGCKLPHRERASVLRKVDESAAADADAEMDDVSSDDDGESVDSFDVDSDEVDEFIGQDAAGDSSFADQRDFIEL